MKNLSKFCFIAMLSFLASCASIIHGPKQDINVSSSPNNADIFIDGELQGKTPKIVTLKRKQDNMTLELQLEGYMPYSVKLDRKVDGWFWGNILFGGIIGIIVDAANGSMYKLKPDEIMAQLTRDGGAAQVEVDKNNIYIAVTLDVDPNWEKIGELRTEK